MATGVLVGFEVVEEVSTTGVLVGFEVFNLGSVAKGTLVGFEVFNPSIGVTGVLVGFEVQNTAGTLSLTGPVWALPDELITLTLNGDTSAITQTSGPAFTPLTQVGGVRQFLCPLVKP